VAASGKQTDFESKHITFSPHPCDNKLLNSFNIGLLNTQLKQNKEKKKFVRTFHKKLFLHHLYKVFRIQGFVPNVLVQSHQNCLIKRPR